MTIAALFRGESHTVSFNETQSQNANALVIPRLDRTLHARDNARGGDSALLRGRSLVSPGFFNNLLPWSFSHAP